MLGYGWEPPIELWSVPQHRVKVPVITLEGHRLVEREPAFVVRSRENRVSLCGAWVTLCSPNTSPTKTYFP